MSLLDLCKSFGLSARAIRGSRNRLSDLPIPSIVFLDDQHCVVYDGRGASRAYESVRVFEPVTRHAGDEDARRLRDLWTGEAIVFVDVAPSAAHLFAVSVGATATTIVAMCVFGGAARALARTSRGTNPSEGEPDDAP